MHDLLGVLEESHWRNWIAQDIEEWEDRHSVTHHLSAYGGMGSFNDIGFEDVWFGSLFNDLQSACYYFARHPIGKLSMTALRDSMGSLGFEIAGWRCLACGYGAVSRRDIDYFVARRVIREAVLEAAADAKLRELVRSVVEKKPSNNTLSNDAIAGWVRNGGIEIRESSEWLRPCSACNSDDTAVYRWRFTKQDGGKFIPSADNLAVRGVKAS
jgi:uncharacterized protein DUF6966